ncbi:MAG: ABC transporter permease, partial [Thermomicrobiales bacterium]|nr:ABC transporter permease [Thermomicrobiales bacterium]
MTDSTTTASLNLAGAAHERAEPEARGRQFWRSLLRSAKGLTGAVLLAIAIVSTLAAPLIAPYDPTAQSVKAKFAQPSFVDPDSGHLFGGDNLGRDLFSRVLYGGRASLAIGVLATTIAAVLGSILGGIAGFQGGPIDSIIMRLVDLQLSIPFILLALIFLAILGPGFWSVFAALSVALWVNYARLIRGETLKIREAEYVLAAKTTGLGPARILAIHILPNVLHAILILATLDMAWVIIFESSLTFLGLGIQPPTPT